MIEFKWHSVKRDDSGTTAEIFINEGFWADVKNEDGELEHKFQRNRVLGKYALLYNRVLSDDELQASCRKFCATVYPNYEKIDVQVMDDRRLSVALATEVKVL